MSIIEPLILLVCTAIVVNMMCPVWLSQWEACRNSQTKWMPCFRTRFVYTLTELYTDLILSITDGFFSQYIIFCVIFKDTCVRVFFCEIYMIFTVSASFCFNALEAEWNRWVHMAPHHVRCNFSLIWTWVCILRIRHLFGNERCQYLTTDWIIKAP